VVLDDVRRRYILWLPPRWWEESTKHGKEDEVPAAAGREQAGSEDGEGQASSPHEAQANQEEVQLTESER